MPDQINPLLDEAIRRQVVLERLKSGQVRDFNTIFPDIAAEVRHMSAGIDVTGATRKAFDDWLGAMESQIHTIYKKQLKLLTPELEKISGVYAALEAGDITKATLGKATMKLVTPRQAFGHAKKLPMAFSGESMEDFVGKLAGNETARVVGTFRKGYYQGKTNTQLVKEVIGTKAANYKDGILDVSRRNASTTVRTSVQHVASAGRSKVWENNKDVVDQYEWVSTLDGKTSNQCKSLDGQKWDIGKGPTPPIHPNCRSTTVAVLADEFKFLSEGRTRSSKDGPVSADENYYDWLKKQDAAFQDTALGKTRGKLFRDGGLTAEQFRDLNLGKDFKPLSLAEMKVAEPEAFAKAFGSGPAVKPPVAPVAPVDPNTVVPSDRVVAIRKEVAGLMSEGEARQVKFYEAKKAQAGADWRDAPEGSTNKDNFARQFYDYQGKANAIIQAPNSQARKAFTLPDSARGVLSYTNEMLPTKVNKSFQVNAINTGSFFLERVVKKELLPKGVKIKKIHHTHVQRAYYSHFEKAVYLTSTEGAEVVVHEFIHNLEYAHADISRKTKAFLKKRAEGKGAVSLKQVKGGNYDPSEVAFEDKWEERGGNLYTGKEYMTKATEIMTMGVQRLFESPVLFAQQDPEFFEFILSIIQD
tara:strand:- start:5830 stop:7752 length:1923 start_codon:yes stop_codon:yes gene_type:complete